MASGQPSDPAFGQADLSNCEREQIHLAGSIQPHGALLVVREADGVVVQASANAAGFLGLDGPVIGQTVEALGGDLAAAARRPLRAVRCRVPPPGSGLGVRRVRRPAAPAAGGGGWWWSWSRPAPAVDVSARIDAALHAILGVVLAARPCRRGRRASSAT